MIILVKTLKLTNLTLFLGKEVIETTLLLFSSFCVIAKNTLNVFISSFMILCKIYRYTLHKNFMLFKQWYRVRISNLPKAPSKIWFNFIYKLLIC